ncbi:MAG: hypothetical protein F6K55_03275 [Moorea sp. SIO4A3]|nr:hypothetical protein [Moorena sp. SIO4A3]
MGLIDDDFGHFSDIEINTNNNWTTGGEMIQAKNNSVDVKDGKIKNAQHYIKERAKKSSDATEQHYAEMVRDIDITSIWYFLQAQRWAFVKSIKANPAGWLIGIVITIPVITGFGMLVLITSIHTVTDVEINPETLVK